MKIDDDMLETLYINNNKISLEKLENFWKET